MQYLDDDWIKRESNKFIGDKHVNSNFLEFTIKEAYSHKYKNSNKYKVAFTESGYETFATKTDINKGLVRDKLTPSVVGVGMLGYATISDNANKKEYSIWSSMLSRCYDVNNTNYIRYGAKGVSVCRRWLRFDYFLEDICDIDGYDENSFKSNTIYLDKDKKQFHLDISKRVYSKDTCCFLSQEDNDMYRKLNPANKISITARNIEYQLELNFDSMADFCKYTGIKKAMASYMLKNSSIHKGWIISKIK